MTDPEFADATYVEPVTPELVAMIIEKEKPDAILPTMGGQTGLNTALSLAKMGVLDTHGVELIGAKREAIDKAEDRELFQEAMTKIGPRERAWTHCPFYERGLGSVGRDWPSSYYTTVIHARRHWRWRRL